MCCALLAVYYGIFLLYAIANTDAPLFLPLLSPFPLQDLPNYAQNMVPIFSLPQDWLWCESWCSDGSKKTAKTIDLCNNPRFKEPKLDMAKRVSAPLLQ